MFDLVTIGHSTVDYFLKISQAEVVTPADGDSRICLDFDDKIPVDDFSKEVGGNAPNAAVGVARLGLRVASISWIGKDAEAEMILRALKNEGVETLWVTVSSEERTDESIVLDFGGGRTILAYHFPRKYHLPSEPPPSKWLYLTSTGEDFRSFHREVLSYAEKLGAKLAYNPGMYELAAGREANREVISGCEVLILNSEEAGELVEDGFVEFREGQRAEQIGELMRKLKEVGAGVVVVTDGAGGAYAYDGSSFFHVPSVATTVVELTGAGDSFSAGFLAAQILGKSLEEALRWGCVNSAAVISKVGSQAGLLTRKELEKALSA